MNSPSPPGARRAPSGRKVEDLESPTAGDRQPPTETHVQRVGRAPRRPLDADSELRSHPLWPRIVALQAMWADRTALRPEEVDGPTLFDIEGGPTRARIVRGHANRVQVQWETWEEGRAGSGRFVRTFERGWFDHDELRPSTTPAPAGPGPIGLEVDRQSVGNLLDELRPMVVDVPWDWIEPPGSGQEDATG